MPLVRMTSSARPPHDVGPLLGQLSRSAAELFGKVTGILSNGFHVPADRIYIEMTAASAERWGYDGSTFA